jgi:hypothetical protein
MALDYWREIVVFACCGLYNVKVGRCEMEETIWAGRVIFKLLQSQPQQKNGEKLEKGRKDCKIPIPSTIAFPHPTLLPPTFQLIFSCSGQHF